MKTVNVPQYTRTTWEDGKTWVEQEALNNIEEQVVSLTDVAVKNNQVIEELLIVNENLVNQLQGINEAMGTMTESFNTLQATLTGHLDY